MKLFFFRALERVVHFRTKCSYDVWKYGYTRVFFFLHSDSLGWENRIDRSIGAQILTLNTHTKWDVPGENLVTPEIQGAG